MIYDFVDSVGYDDASKWTERDRLQWERGCLAGLARAYGLVMSGKDPHPETGEAMFGLIKLIELENWITFQEERIRELLNGDEEQ